MTKQAVDCRFTNTESENVSEFDTPIPEWSSRLSHPFVFFAKGWDSKNPQEPRYCAKRARPCGQHRPL
jgi:hypothetical protein